MKKRYYRCPICRHKAEMFGVTEGGFWKYQCKSLKCFHIFYRKEMR